MPNFARGAAFVDRNGTVLAADPGFLVELALEPTDPTGALRRRAESEPALKDLIAGVGPAAIRLMGPDGGAISVERQEGPGGALLVTRTPRDGEWLEHAARSQGLARLAAGLAHDIKNPLNAMALQLALLGEKLGEGDLAASSASHLGALRDQITKVNEVVRRFCDVTDPAAPFRSEEHTSELQSP
jgi:signal transduction histidine kinase